MSVFVILSEEPQPQLSETIAQAYPDDHLTINTTQWIVSADTTARSLTERLGIRDGVYGRAVVFQVTGSASGYHATSLWEWLRAKGEQA